MQCSYWLRMIYGEWRSCSVHVGWEWSTVSGAHAVFMLVENDLRSVALMQCSCWLRMIYGQWRSCSVHVGWEWSTVSGAHAVFIIGWEWSTVNGSHAVFMLVENDLRWVALMQLFMLVENDLRWVALMQCSCWLRMVQAKCSFRCSCFVINWPCRNIGVRVGVSLRMMRDKQADVMWCDVMWCDVMWCDVTWRDVTWRDVTWRDVTWRDVMPLVIIMVHVMIECSQNWICFGAKPIKLFEHYDGVCIHSGDLIVSLCINI